jgi:hypothetical protein
MIFRGDDCSWALRAEGQIVVVAAESVKKRAGLELRGHLVQRPGLVDSHNVVSPGMMVASEIWVSADVGVTWRYARVDSDSSVVIAAETVVVVVGDVVVAAAVEI